jgi:hypothetical protein
VIDKTQEDAAVLGVALPETEPQKDFEVFKENMPAVELFLRVQTQWRTSIGGVTGLDYASVISTAKLYKYRNLHSVLEDLQVMEVTAMAELNKETK